MKGSFLRILSGVTNRDFSYPGEPRNSVMVRSVVSPKKSEVVWWHFQKSGANTADGIALVANTSGRFEHCRRRTTASLEETWETGRYELYEVEKTIFGTEASKGTSLYIMSWKQKRRIEKSVSVARYVSCLMSSKERNRKCFLKGGFLVRLRELGREQSSLASSSQLDRSPRLTERVFEER